MCFSHWAGAAFDVHVLLLPCVSLTAKWGPQQLWSVVSSVVYRLGLYKKGPRATLLPIVANITIGCLDDHMLPTKGVQVLASGWDVIHNKTVLAKLTAACYRGRGALAACHSVSV
jgi:hypothetical protein